MILKRPLLFLFLTLLVYICYFSIKQWSAEIAYPIEKSFMQEDRSNIEHIKNKVKRLNKAIALSPDIDKYHLLLGKYYVYEKPKKKIKHKERKTCLRNAEEEYLIAISLNPSYTDVLAYLAWVEFSLGKPFKALKSLGTAISIDKNNYFNHLYYGICISNFLNSIPKKMRNIYIERAHKEFKKGIELNPSMEKHPSVFMGKANLYLVEGDIESAINQIEKVGAIDKKTLPYYLKLADLYLKAGREKDGLRKYEDILMLSNIDIRERKKIVDSLRREIRKYPENIGLKLLIGRAYFEDKDLVNAKKILRDVAINKPDIAEVHFMLGQVYEFSGNKEAAYKEYLKTLEYSKNHTGASKKIVEYYR